MTDKKYFLIAMLALFTLMLSPTFAANPGHSASSVSAGTFESGNFIFPNNLQINQNLSVSNINKVIVVDGVNYAQNSMGIQSAINALPSTGGEVFLPPGTYTINSTIMLNKSGITLGGSGYSTVLSLASNTNAENFSIITNTNWSGCNYVLLSNITLENFRIYGNKQGQTSGTQHGIYFYGNVSNSVIRNLWIENMRNDSIYFAYSCLATIFNHGTVSGCTLQSNNGTGIHASYPNNDVFINNVVKLNNIDGINIGENRYGISYIVGNIAEANGGYGIYASGSTILGGTSIISGNDVKFNNVGIRSSESIITDNLVAYNTANGIQIEDKNLVSNNQVISNGQHGIVLWGSMDGIAQNNVISNNYFYDNGGSGNYNSIYVGPHGVNNTVSSNEIVDTSGTGSAIYVHPSAVNTILTGNYYSGTGATKIDDTSPTTRYLQQNRLSIAVNNSDYGAAVTALMVNQSGTGKIMELINGTTSVFSVLANGNVSIGTTGLGALLSIQNSQTNGTTLLVRGASDTAGCKNQKIVDFQRWDNTSMFYIDTDGSPYGRVYTPAQFYALGSVVFSSSYTQSNIINSGANLVVQGQGNLNLQTYSGGNGNITLIPGGTGKVGINTTSPQAKLSVNGSGELLRIGNETNTFLYVNGTEALVSTTGDVQNLLNTSPGLRFANIIPYPSAGSYAVYDTIIAGKYLYAIVQVLGEPSYRFMIYDISNPYLPVSVGNITNNTAIVNPGTIYISGRYAYLGGGANFTIVDISNPSSPSIVSTTNTAPQNVDHSTGFGHYVVLYGIYDAGIYDVLDPTSPRRVSTLTTWGWNRLYVSGNYLYIAAHGGGSCATDGRFSIYDITNPVSPTLVNVTTTIDCPEEIFVSGNYAFLASRGNVIDIYNISNQSKPTLVRNVSLTGSPGWYVYGIFVSGRYMYALSDRINIFDISNINSPVKVWTSPAIHGQGARIRVSGKYVITAPANGEARIYEIPGIETTALNAHSAEVGSLSVSGDAYIDNRLSVRTDLRVGSEGMMCQGDAGFQKNLSVLGSVGIGTTNPQAKLDVNGTFLLNNSGTTILFANKTNVGIGTTTPSARMHIKDSKVNDTVSVMIENNAWPGESNTLDTVQIHGRLSLWTQNPYMAGTITFGKINNWMNSANTTGYISFNVTQAFGTVPEVMRLTSSGKVGVGTTSPNNLLHLYKSSGDPAIQFEIPSRNVTMGIDDSTPDLFRISRTGSVVTNMMMLINTTDGKVTIGTTAPLQKLNVEGSTNTTQNIYVGSDAYIGRNIFVGNTLIYSDAGSGRVGIGTAYAGAHLDIANSSGNYTPNAFIRLKNDNDTTGAYTGILFSSRGGPWTPSGKSWFGTVHTASYGVNDFVFLQSAAQNDDTVNSTDEVMRLTSSGKVGVGTTSPQAKLSVNGTGTASGELLRIGNETNTFLYVNGTEGRVGIGTTGPGAKLTVSTANEDDSTIEAFRFQRDGYATSYYNSIYSGSGSGHNRLDFYLSTTGGTLATTPVLTLRDGNVGINTLSPTAKLSVNGNITLGSMTVQANKALCWTSDKAIGYCSSVVASDGSCTCNAIT